MHTGVFFLKRMNLKHHGLNCLSHYNEVLFIRCNCVGFWIGKEKYLPNIYLCDESFIWNVIGHRVGNEMANRIHKFRPNIITCIGMSIGTSFTWTSDSTMVVH